ncbi:mutator type transposase [Tanacetum coccineum]|uniref:Mutator type transposase n=1 Tax=Tanacetum coccineum TaxID=301880 RepID=A0ABQ5GVC4_9ASTR
MVKLSVDLNEPKDSSKTDIAAQNGRTPKSLTLEIHHGGWFTPTPSRSYIGGHVSSVNVVDINEFCLHDLKDMIVKLGYGVKDLMYYHFLIPSLGLDYGLHSLNVDADVLEMAKYVKDYKIILVYVEHGSSNVDTSIFVTPKKGVAIVVDNHLRKAHIEIDNNPDVNRNLTPMCHRILKKEWEHVSSKSLSIGEVMKILTKKQPSSFVEAPIVVECVEDPFEELDDILGNSSAVDDVLELKMPFETKGVGPVGKFKEVEVDVDNESEKVSDIEGDYTMDSDSEDLDYDPKHDDVFDDDEHIVEEVHVNMNNFRFTTDPKHDTSIGGVDVQDDDLDVIDYDSFGSVLDDEIDSERRMQLKELIRIGKQKNKGLNKYNFYLGQQFTSKKIIKGRVKKHSVETRRQLILVKNDNERVRVRCEGIILALVPYVATDNNTDKNVFSKTKGGPAIREKINSGKQNILGKDKTVEGKGKKVNTPKKVDKNSCPWTMLVTYTKECRWEVRTLIEDHTCIQSRAIKACTSRFLADHVIKSLATNPDIPVRAVQDQMQKQFEVGVSKMKAFRAKRIASDIMTGSTTVRIDVQQEPNPESLTRTFRRVYVCLGVLKQGFIACGREILGLDGCFMSDPWPGQILTAVRVDANNGIYPVTYAIVEAESKRDLYKPLQNATKATSKGEFKKKMGELKSFNSDAYDWLMKIPLEQWSRAYFSNRAKCDLLINNIREVFNRQKLELTGIPCKHVVAAIYNMFKNSVGVGIHEQWVHAAYKLKTWAHVYSFKVNPCNRRDMWPVVESRTVIIPPLYKLPIGRPPNKRKKSNGEIASQSASSSKLSRKGKSVSCGKCGNVGHNRKDYRGQGGGSSQAGARKVFGQAAGATNVFGQAVGARKVSGQAAGATNVSGQAAGARKVSGQVAGATNVSGQAAGARMVSGQAAGAKKVSGQVVDARKASSQPNAVQSTIKQGPRQGFQGPIAGPASGSQRKTKKLMDL